MFKLLQALCLSFGLIAAAAAAGEPYEQARFDALMKQGKPVLVWIHADWCPTCRAQERILDELLPRPELRGLSVLRVDFDHQKPVVQAFRAVRQSTFILFKAGREVARSLGDTRRDSVLAFLKQAM
jgi:thioredoxin-like negative regulator of GroEL